MNTETLSPYQLEIRAKEAKNLADIAKLKVILAPTLESLGLEFHSALRNEDSDSLTHYIIKKGESHRTNRSFEIYITANGWGNEGKCHFSPKGYYQHRWYAESYNGQATSESLAFEYKWELTREEKESIGLVQIEHDYPISQLSKTSKIDKNPKLIISDFLKLVTPYIKIVELVEPRIQAKIEQNEGIIAKINTLETAFSAGYKSYAAKGRKFTRNGNTVEIDSQGHIQVTHAISLDDALAIASREETNKED